MGREIRLLGSRMSLFCVRVEWALRLKGVEYEYVPEDLRNKSDLLLKSNPVHKKVPVLLVEDGRAIAESLVILEYIDERWKGGHKLLPEDPYDRAQARFWALFADSKCSMAPWAACIGEGEDKAKAMEVVSEMFDLLEKQLQGKEWFGGDEIGYLDVALGGFLYYVGVVEEIGEVKILEEKRFPLLNEWVRKFLEVPGIRECLPPRDTLVDHLKAYLGHAPSLEASRP
ncbi:hypothetical protein MLD38_013348 [Melastoma candidum]|uniref:Uncharacterized protein n=1 Tax=Melastoma candidum TaxID=119954 RepID=A0ACB9RCY2_9MYRT|nr:hypothetical protein MLD38_013348 [Melastoma candidum]